MVEPQNLLDGCKLSECSVCGGEQRVPGPAVMQKCSGPPGKEVSLLPLQKTWPWSFLGCHLILVWLSRRLPFPLIVSETLSELDQDHFRRNDIYSPYIVRTPPPRPSLTLSPLQLLRHLPSDGPKVHSLVSCRSPPSIATS